MWRQIKYIYYRLYKFFLKLNGADDYPEHTAMLAIGLILFLAFGSIVSLFKFLNNVPVADIGRIDFIIKVMIPYSIVLYFIFMYKNRYKSIIAEFENEDERSYKSGSKKFTIFLILMIFAMTLPQILIILYNEGIL